MSGMRNEPPISTSCPLETITSFPSAKELRANRTAEGSPRVGHGQRDGGRHPERPAHLPERGPRRRARRRRRRRVRTGAHRIARAVRRAAGIAIGSVRA